MEKEELKEEIKQEIKQEIKKKSNKNIMVVLLTILVVLLTGYIVVTDFIMKPAETKEPEQQEEKKAIEITEDIKKELTDILGFSETKTSYSALASDEILFKSSGVVDQLTLEEKKGLIYDCIYRNKLYTVVKGEEYEYCMAGKGTCEGVTEEQYKKAAAQYGITSSYTEIFSGDYQQYNNMYLLNNGGTVILGDIEIKLTYNSTEDGIEVINDYTITPQSGKKETIRKTYLFKNNGTSYYLYSIV